MPKATAANEAETVAAETPKQFKRRGRPPGSKNKPKPKAVPQLSAAAKENNATPNAVIGASPIEPEIAEEMSLEIEGLAPSISLPTVEKRTYDIKYMHTIRDSIELNPPYQRHSGVWPSSRRKTLLATILFGWIDIPKIYLRKVVTGKGRKGTRYEVTDGKQRLTTMFDFIDNKIRLGNDIPELEGKRFKDLSPELQDKFMSFDLDVVIMNNYDEIHVRQAFTLLQQGVQTNAQENRNASVGYVRDVVATLAEHEAFNYVNFTNTRMGFQQVSSQLLLITLNEGEPTRISKPAINEMYTLLKDEDKYKQPLDDAHDITSKLLTFFAEAVDGLADDAAEDAESESEENGIPKGVFGKGSFITMYTVLTYLAKTRGVMDYPHEFIDNYVDFYRGYQEARKSGNNPLYLRYDKYVGSGGDSEEAIRERRDIVLEVMSDWVNTLPEQDNSDMFNFGIDYDAIKQEAIDARNTAEAEKLNAKNNHKEEDNKSESETN